MTGIPFCELTGRHEHQAGRHQNVEGGWADRLALVTLRAEACGDILDPNESSGCVEEAESLAQFVVKSDGEQSRKWAGHLHAPLRLR